MAKQKRWYQIEFSEKASLIPALVRESLLRKKVLDFLNRNNLGPDECKITCHTETAHRPIDPKPQEQNMVYQIFYYSSGQLFGGK